MRVMRHVMAVAGLMLFAAGTAVGQIAPGDLGDTGFFGVDILGRLRSEFAPPALAANNTKAKPVKVELLDGYGVVYEFLHKGSPILVFHGAKAFGLGADVILPSDAFVMKQFTAIYAKGGGTMTVDDFPAELKGQLSAFWPTGVVSLLGNGVVVRAEPAGRVFEEVKEFLKLDQFSGRDVVLFSKSKQSYTVGYMAVGDLARPFGIELTLTNAEFAFTRKTGNPSPVISVASHATVYGHQYQFMAEGSKATAPDIFLLKSPSLAPKELSDLARAFAQPLFSLAAGADPGFNFAPIPSFSLHPPTRTNPDVPTADAQQVVVFAARPGARHPEWKIEGPALSVRGSLRIDLLDQTVGSVDVQIGKAKLEATYGIPNFSLPGTDVTFFSAMQTISVSSSRASMSITAESPSDCFNQKFHFAVSSRGVISVDADLNKTLNQLGPEKFAANFTACAKQGVALAGWVLKTGDKVLGFASDKMMQAAAPVFGGENVAAAAKAAGYSRDLVAQSLAKVLDKDAMLDIAKKVYGNDQVAAFGKAAGYAAADIFSWSRKNTLAVIGEMPKFGFGAGKMDAIVKWYGGYMSGAEAAAKLVSASYFKDDVLDGGKQAYSFTWGAVSRIGRAAGYGATDITHYFWARGVPKKEITEVLQAGGYAKDEVKNAAVTVYHFSATEAEKAWDAVVNAGEQVGDGACKVIGLVGIKC